MQIVTQNYGLAGGQLNAQKHIEAALPRLLTNQEQVPVMAQLSLLTQMASKRAVTQFN